MKRFAKLADTDIRDIAMWLLWSRLGGYEFKSGRHAAREFVRHALNYRSEWLALPRHFRKLTIAEVIRKADEYIAATLPVS